MGSPSSAGTDVLSLVGDLPGGESGAFDPRETYDDYDGA